jgi:hypothetical protein
MLLYRINFLFILDNIPHTICCIPYNNPFKVETPLFFMSLLRRLAPLALLGSLVLGSPQPAKALDIYLDADVGAFAPSDSNIQKIYGTMPKFGVGLGVESNGWGAEVNFSGSVGNKTTTMSSLTQESDLTNLEVALRAQKAFGRPGQDIRFYGGLELLYAHSSESVQREILWNNSWRGIYQRIWSWCWGFYRRRNSFDKEACA